MSNQLSEKSVSFSGETTSQTNITSNKAFKNGLTLSLVMAVLLLFNYSLYARLSPKEIKSLYAGSYVNEFNRSIVFESDGWFETEGDWLVAEGMLAHTNFYTPNPTLMIPLRAHPEDTVYFSADVQIGSNRDGGGLRFNMESPAQLIHSHRVAILRQGDQAVLTGGYYEESLEFKNQFLLYLDLQFEANTQANLLITATSDSYDVYLNGNLMIDNVPAVYPPAWHGFSAIGNSTAFERVEIEIGSEQQPEKLAPFLDYAQSFEEIVGTNEPSNLTQELVTAVNLIESSNGNLAETDWLTVDGIWNARNSTFIQSDGEQADTYAIFQSPHTIYQLNIELRHLQEQALGGGGIVFGLAEPDSLKNGFLARFADDGSGFFYGRYDENEVLEGIGFHPFSPVQNETQKIILSNNGTQFSLTVNDQLIVEGLDHQGEEGHFGLISNEAKVIFEQVYFSAEGFEEIVEELDSIAASVEIPLAEAPLDKASSEQQSNEASVIVVSGEWLAEGDSIIQNDPEPVDHIGGLDRFEKQFSIKASLTMANDPDLMNGGGGFIFNMLEKDSQNGAQIVRFLNGGSEVIWGYFNESGQFVGQSGVALGLSPNDTQSLGVRIDGPTFEIWVNDELVAADLPLQQTEGWVGLMTFGGPVAFADLDIQSISQE